MITVLLHQFAHLLRSLQTWVALSLAALLIGYTFLGALEFWIANQAAIAASDHAPGMTGFLSVRYLEPLCLLLSLLAPLMAMRSFSEDYREGSHTLWLVAPLRSRTLVVGKFLGVLLLMSIPILISLSLVLLLGLRVPLEVPVLLSASLGLFCCVAACTAVGVFFSSLTKHQIVALIAAILVILLLWFIGNALHAELPLGWMAMLSIPDHLGGFFQGYLQSRGLIYFLTVTLLFLGLTILRIDSLRTVGY